MSCKIWFSIRLHSALWLRHKEWVARLSNVWADVYAGA